MRYAGTAALCLLLFSPAWPGDFTAQVIGVPEGDLLIVLHQGKREKIRLSGIDCPELDQPFGVKARQLAAELTSGKTVSVVPVGTDRRDRTVADVFLPDDRLLNHELVKAGLAWWHRGSAFGNETLEQLETDARKAHRGLWADKEPVPPWVWRRGHRTRR